MEGNMSSCQSIYLWLMFLLHPFSFPWTSQCPHHSWTPSLLRLSSARENLTQPYVVDTFSRPMTLKYRQRMDLCAGLQMCRSNCSLNAPMSVSNGHPNLEPILLTSKKCQSSHLLTQTLESSLTPLLFFHPPHPVHWNVLQALPPHKVPPLFPPTGCYLL